MILSDTILPNQPKSIPKNMLYFLKMKCIKYCLAPAFLSLHFPMHLGSHASFPESGPKLLYFFQQESIQLQLSSFPNLREEDKSSKDDSEKEKEKDKNKEKDRNSEKTKIRMLSKGEQKYYLVIYTWRHFECLYLLLSVFELVCIFHILYLFVGLWYMYSLYINCRIHI